MATLDVRAQLRGTTEFTHGLIVKDLNAVGDAQASASPGGVARNAVQIAAECAAINGMVAGFLTTGEFIRASKEEQAAYYAAHETKEAVLATLEKQTQTLLTAIDGMDEATMGDIIPETPLGPMSRFAIAQLPAMHMMYHDGQLNYIHTLHGDDKMHW